MSSQHGVLRHGIVIFDTRYGNTEKIAKSIAQGLTMTGIDTQCLNVKEVRLETLKNYDVIVVGAPTEWLTASKEMKSFLEELKNTDLVGKPCFTFDTKLDRHFSGSAAKSIEKALKRFGLQIITPSESATVFMKNGSTNGAWLKEGEEARFVQIGTRVGNALVSKEKEIKV